MKNITVVAAFIEHQDKILIAQRGKGSDMAGKWELPGGKVEPGETQTKALIRELKEELNIEATVTDYIACSQFRQPERLITLYAWRVPHFRGTIHLNFHTAMRWVSPQDAQHFQLSTADIPLLQAYIAFTTDLSRF